MPAIAFTVLALALLYARQFAWGGIAAGFALLSGPAMITGILGLGIAYGFARLLGFFEDDVLPDEHPSETSKRISRPDWRLTLLFGGGTILFAGTFFFQYPQGLGACCGSQNSYSFA